MLSRNLPPALLEEWPGYFMCYCSNFAKGGIGTEVINKIINFGEENSPTDPGRSNPWPYDPPSYQESGGLPLSYIFDQESGSQPLSYIYLWSGVWQSTTEWYIFDQESGSQPVSYIYLRSEVWLVYRWATYYIFDQEPGGLPLSFISSVKSLAVFCWALYLQSIVWRSTSELYILNQESCGLPLSCVSSIKSLVVYHWAVYLQSRVWRFTTELYLCLTLLYLYIYGASFLQWQ